MSSILSKSQQQTLIGSLNHISETLCSRLTPLVMSNSTENVYESLTAAVYIMSSAASLQYASRERRLQTFSSWPAEAKHSPTLMAEAGFFSLGEGDHVKCFFCDLGLKDWDAEDDPATEHAKFSPLCFFLKASRGLHWLRSIHARPPNYPSSYTRQDHNRLLCTLSGHLRARHAQIACMLGFSETSVLLCVARLFIRFRKTHTETQLVQELQKETDAVMGCGDAVVQYEMRFNLADVFNKFVTAVC